LVVAATTLSPWKYYDNVGEAVGVFYMLGMFFLVVDTE
jgi:hypothetical protein